MVSPGYSGTTYGDRFVFKLSDPISRLAQSGNRPWIERVRPNPSLNDLYQPFGWLNRQELTRVPFLIIFLLIAISIVSCLLILVKHYARSTTKWHISPVATALIILHLLGDVEFDTFVWIGKCCPTFTALVKGFGLISFTNPFQPTQSTHPQRLWSLPLHRHKGPAAYALVVLTLWECIVFFGSPFYFPKQHPKRRSYGDWLLFFGMMWLAVSSIDTTLELPIIERQGHFETITDTFESRKSFIAATIALSLLFLLPVIPSAIVLDLIFYDACIAEWLDGASSSMEKRVVEQPKQPSSIKTAIQTDSQPQIPICSPTARVSSSEFNINLRVERFMWSQMIAIREQVQMLGQEDEDSEDESLPDMYKGLSRLHFVLSNVRPILDAVITVYRTQRRNTAMFERHLSNVTGMLLTVESKMQEILELIEDMTAFTPPVPDSSYHTIMQELREQTDKLPHLQLDRQQLQEDFEETRESISAREERLQVIEESAEHESVLVTLIHDFESRLREIPSDSPTRWNASPYSQAQPSGESSEEVFDNPPTHEPLASSLHKRVEVESPQAIGTENDPILIAEEDRDSTPRSIPHIEEVAAIANIPPISSPPSQSTPPLMIMSPKESEDLYDSPQVSSPVSIPKDENDVIVRDTQSPPPAIKKSADHMVVGLWEGVTSIIFKSDNFLRGAGTGGLLGTEDLLAFCELGRYLTSKIRGNRAETAAAMKIINNIYNQAIAAKENHSQAYVNVGANNLNYFRSCMWIGQARLTKFPPTSRTRIITEIPIEGIIKISGYGPDGIKNLNMLPLPKETWSDYLDRLEASSDIKKIKELHEWLERYFGYMPDLLNREVPRAEGWDTGVPLDANRCLYRHLENMMLLPPYPPEIENELQKTSKAKKATAQGISENMVEQLLSSPMVKPSTSDFSDTLFQTL